MSISWERGGALLKFPKKCFKEDCSFEEGRREAMFKRSRELDCREDDVSPPQPRCKITSNTSLIFYLRVLRTSVRSQKKE